MGSSNCMSYGNGDGKLEWYPLGEAIGSEVLTKLGTSYGMSGEKVSGKCWVSPLGESLGKEV